MSRRVGSRRGIQDRMSVVVPRCRGQPAWRARIARSKPVETFDDAESADPVFEFPQPLFEVVGTDDVDHVSTITDIRRPEQAPRGALSATGARVQPRRRVMSQARSRGVGAPASRHRPSQQDECHCRWGHQYPPPTRHGEEDADNDRAREQDESSIPPLDGPPWGVACERGFSTSDRVAGADGPDASIKPEQGCASARTRGTPIPGRVRASSSGGDADQFTPVPMATENSGARIGRNVRTAHVAG